jgi:hypothetical protein
MTPSAFALTGFVAWTLVLLLVMEAVRTVQAMTGKVAANAFVPDNANLSPFMQRLARAHQRAWPCSAACWRSPS